MDRWDDKGNVYVNNKRLEEPYLKEKAYGHTDIAFPYQVPEDRIFVMGDNREVSIDSRKHISSERFQRSRLLAS